MTISFDGKMEKYDSPLRIVQGAFTQDAVHAGLLEFPDRLFDNVQMLLKVRQMPADSFHRLSVVGNRARSKAFHRRIEGHRNADGFVQARINPF